MYLTVLIRRCLKVCFEQEFFAEMFMLLKSGSEPLKSWNWLCWVGLQTGPGSSNAPFLGISTSTYTKARVILERWVYPTLAGVQSSVPSGHLNFALTVMHFSKGTDCKQEELWFCVSLRDERSKAFCFLAISQRIIATESGTACGWEQRTGARSTLFIANYLSGLKQGILLFQALLSCSAMTATTTLHMLLLL